MAWIASDNNDLEGALRGYSRAFELNPKDWHALANRAITNHHLDRPVAALHDLDTVAAASPEELAVTYSAVVDGWGIDFATEVQAKRAAVLEKLGQTDQAIETYSAILRRYPAFTFVATELSRLLLAYRNDDGGALEVLTEAARHTPNEWRVPMRIAWIHARQDNTDAARTVLAQITPPRNDGESASFHQGRSRVLRLLGDYGGAQYLRSWRAHGQTGAISPAS
jgi:Flp pilus assembly protein TadD